MTYIGRVAEKPLADDGQVAVHFGHLRQQLPVIAVDVARIGVVAPDWS